MLITGASSGIGLAAATLFAEEGARLALVGRGSEGLEQARERVQRAGSSAHAIVADLGRPEQTDAAVQEAVEWLGGLDVLVSNAGTTIFGPFESISPPGVRPHISRDLYGRRPRDPRRAAAPRVLEPRSDRGHGLGGRSRAAAAAELLHRR